MTANYSEMDATGLAELVATGAASPTELLDEALRRVAEVNPALNAVHNLREETARAAIDGGLVEGPFRGVPFLLKDLGAEAIDYPSHNGSKLFANTVYSYDSELWNRLRATGLVAFGRTASPELGIGPVTEAQVYGGPVRNPWDISRTPGGSSGGSGAAVAAGVIPAAHGSDGGGSVRIPASSCGLVGFKPTRGHLPDGPSVGEGWGGMAIDGYLTRSLRDTAALLDATVGPDLGDPYWAPPLSGTFVEAMKTPPAKLKIAVSAKTLSGEGVHADCKAAVEKTAALLSDLGHEVVEMDAPEWIDIHAMMNAWTRIVACGTALSVDSKGPREALDWSLLDGVTRGAVRYADTVSGADYLASLNAIHAFGRRMERWFQDFDMLVTPTLAEPPMKVGRLKPTNEDFADYRMGPGGVFDYSPYTAAFNASGQPAVSLPLHWNAEDLPIGIHIATRFGDDERLMSLSAQIENAAPWAAKQAEVIASGPRGAA
ncbi:amidase [Rhodobacteraceae bacterium NNCM2]|nr:amidase [Coraliihabitans acroporae]